MGGNVINVLKKIQMTNRKVAEYKRKWNSFRESKNIHI
jgi:hypothetical protein